MKKLLLTLVALFAMSMSVCAQEGPKIWQGGPGKKYAKYKGKKCWFGGATGKDNMGYFDESITYSEKDIIEKENIPTRSSSDPFNVDTGKKKKKDKKKK